MIEIEFDYFAKELSFKKNEKKRYLKIQDCFEFLCPEKWADLDFISAPVGKHCTVFDKDVHRTTNKAQLLKLGKQGKCAAYFEYEEMLFGIINPEVEMKFDAIATPRFKRGMHRKSDRN